MSTLFYNGVIYRPFAKPQIVNWMVIDVSSGKIVEMGVTDTLESAKQHHAQVSQKIDLNGKLVLPGLIEAHIHVLAFGRSLSNVKLRGCGTIKDIQTKLSEYAAKQPTGWIYGLGWDQDTLQEKRLLNRKDVDVIVSDRPVILLRACSHIGVLNSAALERMSITKDTPDPPGGKIDRDENGEPTGILREKALFNVKGTFYIDSGDSMREKWAVDALNFCLSNGVTGVQTNDKRAWNLYKKLCQQDLVPMRVYLTIFHDELDKDYIPKPKETFGKLLECHRVKIISDGSLGAKTASMRDPYVGTKDEHGMLLYDQDKLTSIVSKIITRGYRLEVHAIGDRAAEAVLTAFEDAGVKPEDRPILTHCQILGRDLIDRMKKLNVVANIQPQFVTTDSAWVHKRVKDDVLPYSYAWKTLMDEGIVCAGGSDAPIEIPTPFTGMHAAIFRYEENTTKSWRPQECLSFAEALYIYTEGAAYAACEEHRLGKLEPNYQADFIVVDTHVHEHPEKLRDAKVEQVWIAGKKVYALNKN